MVDELLFRYDQIEFWFYAKWWGHEFLAAYPLTCGLLVGFITGYYIEPFTDWCERMAGRRAMRRKLRAAQKERGK